MERELRGTRGWLAASALAVGVGLTAGAAQAAVAISPSAGYSITHDGNDGAFFTPANPAPVPANLASSVGTQIQSSFLAAGNHAQPGNVNDGLYGNFDSWIGADGDAMPYVGVSLGGQYDLTSLAWGRDNGNSTTEPQFTDRALGTYTVQITNSPTPSTTPNWTTVGTLTYSAGGDGVPGGAFDAHFRHEYGIGTTNGPLTATAVRLLVPATGIGAGTAIDEIELYGSATVQPVSQSGLRSWLKGDGDVVTDGGGNVTQWSDHSFNGNHATPGNSPSLAPAMSVGSINGLPAVQFNAPVEHLNVPVLQAELQNSDYEIFVVARSSDPSIQFLTAAGTGAGVGEYEIHLNGSSGVRFIPSDDSAPGDYSDLGVNGMFTDGRAHLYNARVEDNVGIMRAVGMENGDVVLNARSLFNADDRLTLGVRGSAGFSFVGEMGEVLIYDRALSSLERQQVERYLARKWDAPLNVASQTQGGIAFANQDYPGGVHEIDHLNNALYGNSESWLGNTVGGPGGYAGVKFSDMFDISALAFGRDATGQFPDRSEGVYTFQFTRDAFDPLSLASIEGANWETFLEITNPGPLRSYFEFEEIFNVMGVRVLLNNDAIAIDELEIYGLLSIPEPSSALLLIGAAGLALRRRRRAAE